MRARLVWSFVAISAGLIVARLSVQAAGLSIELLIGSLPPVEIEAQYCTEEADLGALALE